MDCVSMIERLVPVFALTLYCSLRAFAAPVDGFTIHNFMPEFWQFWAATRNQPAERQAELWQDVYVRPHQAVFDDLAAPCRGQFDAEWARKNFLPNLPKITPAMHEMADTLPQKVAAAKRRFLKMFPDMRWSGDIYVMASGYCFNGRAQLIQGRSAILIGVDASVALGQKDRVPGIIHELFHRYHHDLFDFEPSSGYPLWTVLWAEGMAQYVAAALSPGAGEADLGFVPIGLAERVDSIRQELAADFLKRFDSTAEDDAKVYFNDINSKDAFVPARAGYELGVLVVKELLKDRSIQTLAHYSRQQADPRIRQALTAIAQLPKK